MHSNRKDAWCKSDNRKLSKTINYETHLSTFGTVGLSAILEKKIGKYLNKLKIYKNRLPGILSTREWKAFH